MIKLFLEETNLDKKMSHTVSRIVMLRCGVNDTDCFHHLLNLRLYADRIAVIQRLAVCQERVEDFHVIFCLVCCICDLLVECLPHLYKQNIEKLKVMN